MLLIIATFLVWILCFLLIVKFQIKLTKKLLIAGLLLYLIPALYLPAIPDVALWETVGVKSLEGIDFYSFDRPTHGTFPFFPLMIWPHTLFHLISRTTNIPFVLFVRLLVTIFIIGIVFLIGKIINNQLMAKKMQALFLFNPVILLVTALHGQVDMIVAFFVLLTIYLLIIKKGSLLSSAICYGVSILVKTWSVIFLPLFFSVLKKDLKLWSFAVLGTIFSFVLLYMLVFFANPVYLAQAVLSAGGGPGFWGYTAVINLLSEIFPSTVHLSVLLGQFTALILLPIFSLAYFYIFRKNLSLIDSVVFLLLAFLIFTPRWGLQYSSWVLPFAAAAQFKNEINIYSLVASCYLALSYSLLIIKDNLQIIEPLTNIAMLIGLITWCFLILWFVHIIKTRTN